MASQIFRGFRLMNENGREAKNYLGFGFNTYSNEKTGQVLNVAAEDLAPGTTTRPKLQRTFLLFSEEDVRKFVEVDAHASYAGLGSARGSLVTDFKSTNRDLRIVVALEDPRGECEIRNRSLVNPNLSNHALALRYGDAAIVRVIYGNALYYALDLHLRATSEYQLIDGAINGGYGNFSGDAAYRQLFTKTMSELVVNYRSVAFVQNNTRLPNVIGGVVNKINAKVDPKKGVEFLMELLASQNDFFNIPRDQNGVVLSYQTEDLWRTTNIRDGGDFRASFDAADRRLLSYTQQLKERNRRIGELETYRQAPYLFGGRIDHEEHIDEWVREAVNAVEAMELQIDNFRDDPLEVNLTTSAVNIDRITIPQRVQMIDAVREGLRQQGGVELAFYRPPAGITAGCIYQAWIDKDQGRDIYKWCVKPLANQKPKIVTESYIPAQGEIILNNTKFGVTNNGAITPTPTSAPNEVIGRILST